MLQKGEGLVDSIARNQKRIDQLKIQRDGIRRGGFPASHCKAEMRKHITALIERGRPEVSRPVKHDNDIAFVHERAQIPIYNADRPLVGFGLMPDMLGLLAWSHKDQVIAKLDTLIVETCGDDKGMSHADREKAESTVLSELLPVERHQAYLTWEAMRQGLPVTHGPDCAPQAILGVAAVVRPTVPSPTSAHHVFDIVGGR